MYLLTEGHEELVVVGVVEVLDEISENGELRKHLVYFRRANKLHVDE